MALLISINTESLRAVGLPEDSSPTLLLHVEFPGKPAPWADRDHTQTLRLSLLFKDIKSRTSEMSHCLKCTGQRALAGRRVSYRIHSITSPWRMTITVLKESPAVQQFASMSPSTQDKEMKKMQLAFDAASQASTQHVTNVNRLLPELPAVPLGQSSGSSFWPGSLPTDLCPSTETVGGSSQLLRGTLGETFSMIYPGSWTVSIHEKHQPCGENNTEK